MYDMFQIAVSIYEPQGISYVDAYGTFLSNELLPLVEKTVTDKKVHHPKLSLKKKKSQWKKHSSEELWRGFSPRSNANMSAVKIDLWILLAQRCVNDEQIWFYGISVSGTHLLLTNDGAAEKVSWLWWNDNRWRFYHQVRCEPWGQPRWHSGRCSTFISTLWKITLAFFYIFLSLWFIHYPGLVCPVMPTLRL